MEETTETVVATQDTQTTQIKKKKDRPVDPEENLSPQEKIELKIEKDKASVKTQLTRASFKVANGIIIGCILLAVFYPPAADKLDKIGEIIMAGIVSLYSIVGAYVGISTWQSASFKPK